MRFDRMAVKNNARCSPRPTDLDAHVTGASRRPLRVAWREHRRGDAPLAPARWRECWCAGPTARKSRTTRDCSWP